jgi:RHS repeat-associated protein
MVAANGEHAGKMVWSATYDPWGNLLQEKHLDSKKPTSQSIRFQGQHFDEESGLHYNRFRYYDPRVGRYITQDPIGLFGGNNIYAYPTDPILWIDPSGLNGGKEGMEPTINGIRQQGTGVRVGGASASLGKVEVKGAHGERPIGAGKNNNAAVKSSENGGLGVTIGKPCTSKEVALSPLSWKYGEKKLGIGDKDIKGSASVQGPGVSIDPVCVDPAQVLNRTAAEATNGVLNNSGMLGNAVKDISGREAAIEAAINGKP